MGFSRLSKVVGFSILLTEMFLISAGVKKSKSTLSMTDETGWEIFMVEVFGDDSEKVEVAKHPGSEGGTSVRRLRRCSNAQTLCELSLPSGRRVA